MLHRFDPTTFLLIWLVLTPGKDGAIEQYRVAQAGNKEVRNPPCGTGEVFRDQLFRIDPTNRRLFVAGSSDDLKNQAAGLAPRLNSIRAYVAKCHPDWGRHWNASFFADRKFAGYKDEQPARFMKDGTWAKAYLAEYENETGRLTLHPALPNAQRTLLNPH
jgi:hypothetical protein